MGIRKDLKEFENKLFIAEVTGKVDKFAFDAVKKKLDKANNLVERYLSRDLDMIQFNQELIKLNDDFVDFCAIASKGTILKQLLMELTTAIIDYSRFNLNSMQFNYYTNNNRE